MLKKSLNINVTYWYLGKVKHCDSGYLIPVFISILQRLAGATLLVFANKQDLPGSLSAENIRQVSICDIISPFMTVPCKYTFLLILLKDGTGKIKWQTTAAILPFLLHFHLIIIFLTATNGSDLIVPSLGAKYVFRISFQSIHYVHVGVTIISLFPETFSMVI
jgi:hypothetical protein